jgi:hypothetical protein
VKLAMAVEGGDIHAGLLRRERHGRDATAAGTPR